MGRIRTVVGCWLVVLRINVDLAIFQPYLDLEAGDNQSLKIQVLRRGIEPRSSCSTSQELNHSATAAPDTYCANTGHLFNKVKDTFRNSTYEKQKRNAKKKTKTKEANGKRASNRKQMDDKQRRNGLLISI